VVNVEITYIGLDLAWSGRNLTGAAALSGGPGGARLVEPPALLGDLATVVAYVLRHTGAGPAIVAVDAPLCVPNATGRRRAEVELGAAFRRYEAGPYPANRRLLARAGVVRGEALLAQLGAHGFRPAATVAAGAPGRLVSEVYPHAAMVGIFALPRTLKYKARPGRGPAERLTAWRIYQALLLGLDQADPPLAGHNELLAADVTAMGLGAALKRYEDRVDALFCAYIALFAHRWGAARCRSFGSLEEGWILTPAPP
jgi:predicted RNase H-like nuclease